MGATRVSALRVLSQLCAVRLAHADGPTARRSDGTGLDTLRVLIASWNVGNALPAGCHAPALIHATRSLTYAGTRSHSSAAPRAPCCHHPALASSCCAE